MAPRITIGCDPELFIRNKETGKFVSAHSFIPGTKEKPHPVPGGAVQVDGVAAEFNINPAPDYEQFVNNIATVMGSLRKFVGEKHELVITPVATFDKEYFFNLPDHVRELGCNPDFNAWTGEVNPSPDTTGEMECTRTAAGHIHVGWTTNADPNDPNHLEDCQTVIKELDYTLGCTSLMFDKNGTRRKLYGRAGAYRPKSYGVEYRPLSNMWLKDSGLQKWVFQTTFKTIHDMFSANYQSFSSVLKDECINKINDNVPWWNEKSQLYSQLKNRVSFPATKYWEERTTKAA